MFKFSCLIVLIALNFDAGTAVTCYSCIASTDSDCYRGVEASFFKQECQSSIGSNLSVLKGQALNYSVPIETVCVTFVLPDFEPKIVERGCGYIFKGVDICDYMSLITNVESCSYCRSDLCNSSPITS